MIGVKMLRYGSKAAARPTVSLSYEEEVLADSPAAFWKCDEASGNLTDSVGGYTATAVGTSAYQAAGPGGNHAVYLNGSSSYFSVADNNVFSSTSFTLEAWVQPNAAHTGYVFDKRIPGAANKEYTLYAFSSGVYYAEIGSTSGSSYLQTATNATGMDADRWMHVVMTCNGSEVRVFVDGALAAIDTTTSGARTGNTTAALLFGMRNDSPNYYFNGGLSQIAYYPTSLSETRIKAHFDAMYGVTTTDRFQRTVGVSPLGPLWLEDRGTWGVAASGTGYLSATSGTNINQLAVAETGLADGTFEWVLHTIQRGYNYWVFRYLDSDNYLYISDSSSTNVIVIHKVEAGVQSVLATASNTDSYVTAGSLLRVVLSGSSISVYRNSTLRVRATSTFNQTATKHGIAHYKDGGSNALNPRWAGFLAKPSSKLIAADDFTRADNSSSLGSTSTGNLAWTAHGGTWGITSNNGYMSAPAAGTMQENIASFDVGVSDFAIEWTHGTYIAGPTYQAFRVVDNDNYIIVSSNSVSTHTMYISVKQAGSYVGSGTISNTTPIVAGSVIRVECVGPAIHLFLDGVYKGTRNTSIHQTATRVGLGAYSANGTGYGGNARWNSLKVYEL
jgi:hypothetical protein